jgi:glutamate-ammonia-ligase adenylyltransferase
VEIIEKNPAVLDFLTETMVLEQRANRKELLQILRSLREDLSLEKALSTLFEMEIFRIGSQDMLDLRPWPKIGSSLSTLAETILFGAFEEHLKPRPDLQYAVIFLGKMAGKELSYNSDLDMVVLSKDENYESVSFLTSLVHKVIKSVKGIYEIDLRLRPNGKNAPLVVPISAFRKYLEEKGENWERMVYSRNLIYASSPELVREVKGMIRKFTDSRPPDFRESIIEMREKIAANFPPENFKKHYGGIIDIEFITEYLKIFHALKDSNILALMESIRKKDLFPAELLTKMNKGYAFLRKLENSIRLLSNHYSSSLPENEEFRKILAMKLGFSGYENFFSHYKAMREGIRECWDYFRSEVSK